MKTTYQLFNGYCFTNVSQAEYEHYEKEYPCYDVKEISEGRVLRQLIDGMNVVGRVLLNK